MAQGPVGHLGGRRYRHGSKAPKRIKRADSCLTEVERDSSGTLTLSDESSALWARAGSVGDERVESLLCNENSGLDSVLAF